MGDQLFPQGFTKDYGFYEQNMIDDLLFVLSFR